MRNYIIKSKGLPFLNVHKGHAGPTGNGKIRFHVSIPLHEMPEGLKEEVPELVRSALMSDRMFISASSVVPPVIVEIHGNDSNLHTEFETAKWHNIPLDPLLVGLPVLVNVSIVDLQFDDGRRPPNSPRRVLTFHTIGIQWQDVRKRLDEIRAAALKIVNRDDD